MIHWQKIDMQFPTARPYGALIQCTSRWQWQEQRK